MISFQLRDIFMANMNQTQRSSRQMHFLQFLFLFILGFPIPLFSLLCLALFYLTALWFAILCILFCCFFFPHRYLCSFHQISCANIIFSHNKSNKRKRYKKVKSEKRCDFVLFSRCFYDYSDYYAINFVSRIYFFFAS